MNTIKFFACLCFITLPLVAAGQNKSNLVPNPGFEEGTDLPEPWIIHHMIKGSWAEYSKAEWATDEVHSGKKSIKLSVTKSAGRTLGWRISEENPVPVKGGLRVRVSGWMKTNNIAMGPTDYNVPSIIFVTYDVNKKMVRQYWIARAAAENTEWTKYEDVIHLRDEVEYFTLSAGLSDCTGTAWFDDFEVSYEEQVSLMDYLAPVIAGGSEKEKPVIIPQPWKSSYGDNAFFLGNIAIVSDSGDKNRQAREELIAFLSSLLGNDVPSFYSKSELPDYETLVIIGQPEPGGLVEEFLRRLGAAVDWKEMGQQGYVLAVKRLDGKNLVILSGNTEQGIYYAAQTLKQYPVRKEEKHLMAEGLILDKPAYLWRGMVPGGTSTARMDKWMVPLKINVIYGVPGTGSYEWWHPFSAEYKESLKIWVEECRKRFITPVAGTRPDRGYVRRIRFSSREDVEMILQAYRDYYECGIRVFKLAFDDGPPQLEYPEDKARFKNIAEAHYYLTFEIYNLLKKLNPENEFSVCPIHYYNPLEWSPQQKEYIAVLSRLPKDVAFINCSTMTEETALEHKRLTGRKPLNWDNWVARFEGMQPLPSIVPPPASNNSPEISKLSTGYMFPLLDREIFWFFAGDYMWNASRYNPEQSSAAIMKKMFGTEALGKLVEYQSFLQDNYALPVQGLTSEVKKQSAQNLISLFTGYAESLKGTVPEELEREIEETVSNRTDLIRTVLLPQLEEKPLPVKIPATSAAVRKEGLLKDNVRGQAARLTGFRRPWSAKTENAGAQPEQTEVYMMYDADNLYISFVCTEPAMDRIRARMTEHDSEVYLDDCVEMMLSICPEKKDYYHLAVSSIGTVYDAFMFDKTWNSGVIYVKTLRKDGKWAVEIALPFKALGVKAGRGTKLLFNFFRARQAGEKPEFTSWAIVEKRFHEPERFWVMELD